LLVIRVVVRPGLAAIWLIAALPPPCVVHCGESKHPPGGS